MCKVIANLPGGEKVMYVPQNPGTAANDATLYASWLQKAWPRVQIKVSAA